MYLCIGRYLRTECLGPVLVRCTPLTECDDVCGQLKFESSRHRAYKGGSLRNTGRTRQWMYKAMERC